MGKTQNSLPMVRGTILLPILRGLAELGVETNALLEKYDLSETSLWDPGHYVHNNTVYRIYADSAELAGDPRFCATLGSRVDLTKMLAFGNHLRDATTIGDFLIRFTQAVSSDTTSISQSLLIEDSIARFGARRQFVPDASPAHSDAFMVGLWVNFLHQKSIIVGTRPEWRFCCVIPNCCRPISTGLLRSETMARGFRFNFRLRGYPCRWFRMLPLIIDLWEKSLITCQPRISSKRSGPYSTFT